MCERISEAIRIQQQIQQLKDKLSELTQPAYSDYSALPIIYKTIQKPGLLSEEYRMMLCFTFIVVYLYSPNTVLENRYIKPGLCSQIGAVIGRCRQEVSSMYYEASVLYKNSPGFQTLIGDVLKRIPSA